MNALTKVFVVLLVIFSITFTMMTLQFSTSVPDWRGEAMKWKAEAQTVDTHNRNLIAAKVADAGRAAADRRAWGKERDDLTSKSQDVRTELDAVKARLAKAEADTSFKDATIKKLTAELGVAQTSAEKAREHRATLEVTNIELENRNRDLNDALNERITTIIVLEQKARQQDQAINLLRQERDNVATNRLRPGSTWLKDSTVTMPIDKVTAAVRQVVTPIRGRITQVSGTNASISVGSDDGVHEGMVFIISSDQGGYLGDLIISNVEPDGAAGVLKNVVDRISVGSLVFDEKGFVASN